MSPTFKRHIGIDYSGAETTTTSLKGLRVYEADHLSEAHEIAPPPSPRKYWTRKGIAEWLVATLSKEAGALVGIDHGFSFPLRYFEQHGLPPDWQVFLDDFQRHWPTDEDHTYVDFVWRGSCGKAAQRWGDSHWRRITEVRARAKSVFQFDVQGQVAKSAHAGIPWLRYIRQRLGKQVHFWPFDGWSVPPHCSVIAEVYPALWNKSFSVSSRTSHQHDAFSIAEWLRRADANGTLMQFFCPNLETSERQTTAVEGWMLGVL